MAKKSKKDRPPLLSFLLRDFRARPESNEDKKKQDDPVIPESLLARLTDFSPENKTAQLLSALLREPLRRPDPDEEKREKQRQRHIDERLGKEAEDEDEDDDGQLKPQSSEALFRGRFEVLPANPLGEDYLKRAGEAVRNLRASRIRSLEETASQVQRNTDNYRQLYLDQRAQEGALTAGQTQQIESEKRRTLDAAARKAEEQKQAEAQKQADAQRLRARELQNQIAWWRGQQGAGQYDDATINNNIEQLNRELTSIPQGLW